MPAGEADACNSSAAQPQAGYTIQKRARDWLVIGPAGELVCITACERGAEEGARRLAA